MVAHHTAVAGIEEPLGHIEPVPLHHGEEQPGPGRRGVIARTLGSRGARSADERVSSEKLMSRAAAIRVNVDTVGLATSRSICDSERLAESGLGRHVSQAHAAREPGAPHVLGDGDPDGGTLVDRRVSVRVR